MRSLIAVLAGVIVAVALFQLGAVAAYVAAHGAPLGATPRQPTGSYFGYSLGFSAFAAMIGGWVTGRVARRRPLAHVGLLALALVVLVVWEFTRFATHWPLWYPTALALVEVAGALVGGVHWRNRTAA